jgi:hypothetical protein
MTITKQSPKQPPVRGTLFDNILNARSAFKKKPAEQQFPPIMDPELLKVAQPAVKAKASIKTPAKTVPEEAVKRSLLPARQATTTTPKEASPYVYAGSKARRRTEWEEVAYDDALPAEILAAQQNKIAVEQAKAKIRRTASKKALDNRSAIIIETLPKAIRPNGIITNFPHIMNLIAASWHEPRAFVQTLDELLMDDRGNRAGFPFAIIVELTDLREHYFSSVRPEARKLWDKL